MTHKITCDICDEECFGGDKLKFFNDYSASNKIIDVCSYHKKAINKFIKILKKTDKKMKGAKNG